MKGADGKPLKIVQKIAAHDYTTFGMYLLQDENGEEVDLIEKDHISKGVERVTKEILKKWLTSDAPTRTYQHLIECLDQGAYCIFQCLHWQHNNILVYLNLSHTGLEMTKTTARVLGTMLQVNKTLTHLDLSNNFTLFVSTCFSFESLHCNTTLVQLNLSNAGLAARDELEVTAQALTTMLQVNKTLAHLDLSNNWIFQNASCVFQGLQNNTSLVYLNLRNIQLEVKKDTPLAKALTTMLQENKHLKHLDLSYNPFYDEGVYCLCEGLQHNSTLVYLNLSNTRLTDKGVEYIPLACNSNRSLQLTLEIKKMKTTRE